jgi:hypothetical protein
MGLGGILVVNKEFFQDTCFGMGAAYKAASDRYHTIVHTQPVGFAEFTKAFRRVHGILFFMVVIDHRVLSIILSGNKVVCICSKWF